MKKRRFISKKQITSTVDNATMHLDLTKLEKGLQNAQYQLDSAVFTSMKPFIPLGTTGILQNELSAKNASVAGSGKVYAAVGPYGRYLYYGKTMVDEQTGSPWARYGAKKVLVSQYQGKTNAKPDLTFSRGKPFWFDEAKKRDEKEWVKITEKAIGGV